MRATDETYDPRPDSPMAQTAGVVPRSIVLPVNLLGRERTAQISPESVTHIRRRRPQWLAFCLAHIPEVLSGPTTSASDRAATRTVRSSSASWVGRAGGCSCRSSFSMRSVKPG